MLKRIELQRGYKLFADRDKIRRYYYRAQRFVDIFLKAPYFEFLYFDSIDETYYVHCSNYDDNNFYLPCEVFTYIVIDDNKILPIFETEFNGEGVYLYVEV